jgi:ADP-ribose pyrophosphatase
LIDEGETAEECALRELKEETGYVGEIVRGGFEMTPVMFNGISMLNPQTSSLGETMLMNLADPGFCNTNLRMVHVTVDMSKPENQNPKPQLDDNEFIDCFTVPLKSMYTEIQRLNNEGYAIDARVGTLAEGIEIAKRWKLCS